MELLLDVIIMVFYGIFFVAACAFAILAGTASGAATGIVFAVMHYFRAVFSEAHVISPKWDSDPEPAKRSYFFGPGYLQLRNTVVTVFRLNRGSTDHLCSSAERLKGGSGLRRAVMTVGATTFQGAVIALSYTTAAVITLTMAFLHGLIITILMALYFVLFAVVWLVDRLYLHIRRVFSDCAMCHARSVVPHYRCPECGRIHKKLTPGPFGIWMHRCHCGKLLPSTFLAGRGRLDSACPVCGNPLIASDVSPVLFQLVGATYAGKTVFLTSFMHEFIADQRAGGNTVTIPRSCRERFEDLERWFAGQECPSTTDRNSLMYPLLIENKRSRVRRQFSIYDIAGEAFRSSLDELPFPQEQFTYCNGILFVIDPLDSPRFAPNNTGESVLAAAAVATNLVNYLIASTTRKSGSRVSTPLSVIISKADDKRVESAVGSEAIIRRFNASPGTYATLDAARDAVCEEFLTQCGFVAPVKTLRSTFINIHYFPVSAMGHEKNGTQFRPQGVTAPVQWMLEN